MTKTLAAGLAGSLAAALSLLAAGASAQPKPEQPGMDKCYGVSLKGQNAVPPGPAPLARNGEDRLPGQCLEICRQGHLRDDRDAEGKWVAHAKKLSAAEASRKKRADSSRALLSLRALGCAFASRSRGSRERVLAQAVVNAALPTRPPRGPCAPEGRDVLAIMAQHKIGDQSGPSGLVRCAQSLSRLGVEILVEQQKVPPMRVGAERRLALHGRHNAIAVAPIEIGDPLGEQGGATSTSK